MHLEPHCRQVIVVKGLTGWLSEFLDGRSYFLVRCIFAVALPCHATVHSNINDLVLQIDGSSDGASHHNLIFYHHIQHSHRYVSLPIEMVAVHISSCHFHIKFQIAMYMLPFQS